MSLKEFIFGTKIGYLILNIILAILIFVVGVMAVQIWLKSYTEHGIEVEVPNVTGMTIENAFHSADSAHLYIEVIDSTFSNKVPLGTVVEQTPPAYSHAKHGRSIYVVLNSSQRRQIPMPQLTDISYRQAESTLKALGIEVAEVIYEPSEYKDLVLDVRMGDLSLEAGTRVADGSRVTLVVGRGQGTEMRRIPDLRGKTLSECRNQLLREGLTLGSFEYDEEPTPETLELFIVYSQSPEAGINILEGSAINVRLSTDIEKAITADNEEGEENFF